MVRIPIAWLGSTITGRWLSSLRAGTAERSKVNRVWSAKVRIPRSQRITRWFPPAMMYSAAIKNSFKVAEKPRLSSTGLAAWPTALRRSKFCMFRAPIWRMSA